MPKTSRSRPVSCFRASGAWDGGGQAPADLVEQLPGDGRRQDRVAGRDGADRFDDLGARRVLEQRAAGARAQRGDDVIVEPEGGEDQDPLARQPASGLSETRMAPA